MKCLKIAVMMLVVSAGCGLFSGCFGGGVNYRRRGYNRPYHNRQYYRKPTRARRCRTGRSATGSYYKTTRRNGRVVRREGAIWGTVPNRRHRVGLPRNPTSRNIRRKYARDVRYLRNRRRSSRRRRR